jgi:hypothetical protein
VILITRLIKANHEITPEKAEVVDRFLQGQHSSAFVPRESSIFLLQCVSLDISKSQFNGWIDLLRFFFTPDSAFSEQMKKVAGKEISSCMVQLATRFFSARY